ncbi:hypothetical protein K443DRAFT_677859 [Laccaria amethystina LaAM-08-1]|uniref:Unplaced genomic scaffold K443scaffold_62, whole genome shotgun sequence n=1 Tax=Laccaria amethystina LaAM-08-1 TaxID=1095629 RepID=A0A0C9XKQ6_9AGAR|nr:hypothetical protein K443DRAFT_677859 [Laccaria amethystina LaAM-08-1]
MTYRPLWSRCFRSNGSFFKCGHSISRYHTHYLTQQSSVVTYSRSISLENIKQDLGPFGYEHVNQIYLAPYKRKFYLDCGR